MGGRKTKWGTVEKTADILTLSTKLPKKRNGKQFGIYISGKKIHDRQLII